MVDTNHSSSKSISGNLAHTVIETNTLIKSKDPNNRTKLNDYLIIKQIGQGPSSKVKLALNTNTNELYAIKQYNKLVMKKKRELIRGKDGKTEYRDGYQDVLNEINIMKRLNHENIIKLYEVINDPSFNKIYLIIDYYEKGQIIDWHEDRFQFYSKRINESFNEKELAFIFYSALLTVEYLHKNNIIHRDIKPQNLLEDANGNIKLVDFDISVIYEKNIVLNKTKGTLHFMAPELCKKTANYDDWFIGTSSDIWALGITLYSFTYLKLPFCENGMIALINAIENNPHKHHTNIREISSELKDLIDKLLEKNPKKRIKIDQIKIHPWITKNIKYFKEITNIGGRLIQNTKAKDMIIINNENDKQQYCNELINQFGNLKIQQQQQDQINSNNDNKNITNSIKDMNGINKDK